MPSVTAHKKSTPALYALLVGIDHYHQEDITDLQGCINDVKALEEFLKKYCDANDKIIFRKKILKESAATRQAVIKGFDFFKKAKSGDTCLFYFSGHGARIKAPKEFLNESDNMVETIVCHAEKGKDNLIVDKELSYLIASSNKEDVHTVVITDSCHSGSNTKSFSQNIRSIPTNLYEIQIDEYLGRNTYAEIKHDSGEIRLSAPLGRHIKLSACTKNELAKERALGETSEMKGVFTFALLEVLRNNGTALTYSNLLNKTRLIVQAISRDQSPQLELINMPTIYYDSIIFNGVLKEERPKFQVSYKEDRSWFVNAGSIYGVCVNDTVVLEDETELRITEVFPSYAKLDFGKMGFRDRKAQYDSTIRFKTRKKLNLAFAETCSTKVKNTIKKLIAEGISSYIEVNSKRGVDYIVHQDDGNLALTYPGQYTPVFSRIQGFDLPHIRLFLTLVEKVADWHHVVRISNNQSSITEEEIGIQLFTLDKPHAHDNPDFDTSPLVMDNWKEDNVFYYQFDDSHPRGPWHSPFFRMSIKNKSQEREFWISALYCGTWYQISHPGFHIISTGYSSTNKFLPKEKLTAGSTIGLIDEVTELKNTYHYESIQLSILEDYFAQGYNEIKDVIKIFVSTEEIDTQHLNLKGIPIDTKGELSKRPGGKALHIASTSLDWTTFEVPITIVRPRDLGILRKNQDIKLGSITLVGHTAFSARIILSTMEDFIRSTVLATSSRKEYMARPEIYFGENNCIVHELTNGIGNVEGCSVIELYQSDILPGQVLKNPFTIKTTLLPVKDHSFYLFTYNGETRSYIPLSKMSDSQKFLVHYIPASSKSNLTSMGKSIKLFILNIHHQINLEIPSST